MLRCVWRKLLQQTLQAQKKVSSLSFTLAKIVIDILTESPLLLATFSRDKELRVYRLTIDFGSMRANLQHLKIMQQCRPLDWHSEIDSLHPGTMPSFAQLSLLEFVPPHPITNSREYTPPFVLAAFTSIPDESQDAVSISTPLTVISKWEIQTTSPELHPSFGSLSSKKNISSSAGGLSVSTPTMITLHS